MGMPSHECWEVPSKYSSYSPARQSASVLPCPHPTLVLPPPAAEKWLLVAEAALLSLGTLHFGLDELTSSSDALRDTLAVLMALVLVGGHAIAAAYMIRDIRLARKAVIAGIDHVSIDQPVARLLTDGSIKLLRVAWLLDQAPATLSRRQEMPSEAFASNDEAARLFNLGLRKVLVLS